MNNSNNSSLNVLVSTKPPPQFVPILYMAKIDEPVFRDLVEQSKTRTKRAMKWAHRNLPFTFAATVKPLTPPSTVLEEIGYYLAKLDEYAPEFFAARYFLATSTDPSPQEETYCFLLQLNYSPISSVAKFIEVSRANFLSWRSKEESTELLKQFSNSLML